ncbi:MAG: PAS-domain containing protein [Proteobacteria bacterium]|nr:PAS-domain containing protein [Pseudomonadota bacterium]
MCIVDAKLDIRVANSAFRRLFGLPARLVRPGAPLEGVIRYNARQGAYGDMTEEEAVASRLQVFRRHEDYVRQRSLPDGRTIKIRGTALRKGGFVIFCGDVTQRLAAEKRAVATHRRLLDAIECSSEGFALFDNEDRLVLCNARYREMQQAIASELREGVSFEHLVRAMTMSSDTMVPPEEAEAHIARRMAFHRNPTGSLDVPKPGGRWIRVTDRRTAEDWTVAVRVDITDIKRREAILSVVNDAAARLLSSAGWRDQVEEMIVRLGPAAGVSRVTLSRNDITADGAYLQEDLFEWDAPGIRRVMDDEALRDVVLKDGAFQDWRAQRSRGMVVYGLTRDLPDGQRAWFERQGVKSAIRVPVMVEGQWWGTIGFDHCTEERVWQPLEIEALRAVAGLVGVAISRDRDDAQRRRLDQMVADTMATLPQGVGVYDRDQRLQLCNPAFAAVYNARPDAIIGASAEGLLRRLVPQVVTVDGVPITDRDALIARSLARFRDRSAAPLEIEWADGRWSVVSHYPTADGGFVFVRTDITDQKRVQAILRESEALKSAMIDSSLDAIITMSDQGEILEFNPAAERTFKYARDDVLGRRVVDVIVPPHLRHRHNEGLMQLEQNPERRMLGRRVDVEAMRADGSTFPAELSIAEVRLPETRAFTAYVRDISQRQQMERALRESEQRFRGIAEAHPVPVVIVRLADGVIVYASPGSHRLFKVDDCVGTNSAVYYADPADRQRLIAALSESPNIENFEVMLRKGDGSVFPASLSSRRIVWEGEGAIVSGFVDLTEAKRADAEILRQREALAHSEKLTALGSLLAGVAHELNNPLSVVVGQAVMLHDMAADPAVAARAEKIRRAAERCARIVKTFLAMARRRPPEVTALDINSVVEAGLDLLAYNLRTTDITVDLELARDLPRLMADADQLNQVFTNLIVNAQQALMERSPPRRIVIATSHRADRRELVLSVADNGPGVPLEIRSRIFEPFFTTKPTGVGTGVGLSMCQGVVEAHGGRITVGDTPGGGATFTVTLPQRGAVTASPADLPADSEKRQGGAEILVVDDEIETAQTLAEILERAGHSVDIADNGRQALARLAERRYDLILSDLRMPVLDGPGLYRAVAKEHPKMLDRLVFITGDTLAPHVTTFLIETRVACIEKPLNPRTVRETVARRIDELRAAAG